MVALADICELIVDSEHKTAPTQAEGFPMIRTPNIGRGRFILDAVRTVSRETYEAWTRRAIPQHNDLILAREAPVGNVAIVKHPLRPCLGQRTVLIRPNPAIVDPHYICYLLLGDEIQHRMNAVASGATVPHLNMADIRALALPELPPLDVQKKIASVLSAFDGLIANIIRRIAILEEMARAIYGEWFVEFRYPGHEDVPQVESERGQIPHGWEVAPLGAANRIVMGQSPKSEFYNDVGEGLPFHQGVSDFGSWYPSNRRYCTVTKRVAEAGDALVSVRAPVGRINISSESIVIGRGLAAVRSVDDQQTFTIFQLKKVFEVEDAIGGGTIFKAITKGDLAGLPWLLPPPEVRLRFEEIVQPMAQLIGVLTLADRRLRATRDLLLPKLVSGEIDVADLDIDTGAAA